MRIISGKWKGKRLNAPKNLPTRPTTDFAKEALFNILNNRFYIDELNVLDLFAGIGSISFEFASRGAKSIYSVEQNSKAYNFILNTVQDLELDEVQVFKQDVFQFLKRTTANQFDIIFADPPFDFPESEYNKLISQIMENKLLTENGLFVLEHSSKHDFSKNKHFQEHKKYGSVNFSFLKNENAT